MNDDKIEEILYRENLNIPPFSYRLGAFLIDIIFLIFVVWGICFNLLKTPSNIISELIFIQKVVFVFFILTFLYEICSCMLLSASIGKIIFGLRIISLQTLDKPQFIECLYRSITKTIEIILGFVLFAFVFDNKFFRGIHDRVSKTIVIGKKID